MISSTTRRARHSLSPARAFALIVMSGLCLAAMSSGCGDVTMLIPDGTATDDNVAETVVPDETSSDYGASRARWEEVRTENYRYEFRWSCYCTRRDSVEVTVRGDSVARVRNLATGIVYEGASGMEMMEMYETIDSLFDLIDEAETGGAHKVVATYDADKGFPVDVYIDYKASLADEELGFVIRKVVFE